MSFGRKAVQAALRLLLVILALVFALFGLVGMVTTSPVGGLLFVLGAVLMWPTMGDRISKLTGKRWLAPVAGLITVIVIGPAVTVATAPTAEEVTALEEEKIAQREAKRVEEKAAIKAREAQWAQEQAVAAERRLAEEKAELAAYIDRLELEIESIPEIKPGTYANGLASINAGLAVIGAWAVVYEKGGTLDLDDQTERKRQRFRNLAAKKQAQMLPTMRDAYGPAMRQQLWEADGSARTFGPGFRTIEFVSGAFARNANIKKIQEQMRDTLLMLRFTRAEYKWFKQASEYTYYTLEPPKDSDMVRWNPNGTFTILN